ncbi:MAG: DUF898 family protein [Filomicrobium sp.]
MTTDSTGPWTPTPTTPANDQKPSNQSELALSWLAPFGMVGLSFVNFFFRIITLGIYDFWARTEVRKRLWSAIRLNGEPLVYTGTGKELFLGFLIVFGIVLLPLMLLTVAIVFFVGPDPILIQTLQFAIYIAIFFLIGIGIYRAQRYRLSRTTWRGIRGSLTGSSLRYAVVYFATLLLIPFTLGWIIPWRTTKLQSMITNNAHLGTQPFSFSGSSGPLYGPFALLWFGVIAITMVAFMLIGGLVQMIQGSMGPEALEPGFKLPPDVAAYVGVLTLGIFAFGYLLYLFISAWYRARTINHFARCTLLDTAQFKGRVTGAGLLWIDITNLLILMLGVIAILVPITAVIAIIASLGGGLPDTAAQIPTTPGAATGLASVLAPLMLVVFALSFTLLAPVTQARAMGYLINNLSIEGTLDLDKIAQGSADQLKTGEGLSQAFDIDAF